jgi:hypothetical protein
VTDVSIRDSIIQRSNLLSFYDINGNCTGNVVIEDGIVKRSAIGSDVEVNDSVMQGEIVVH